ncbi:hypothetical protein [Acinetobacter sp. YH12126]|uniref:hypothetical protein n=1 Tax=Acinetobacter sp. YH12126 TaxID=2601111 RepID=UPI0015D465D4|nr:hypothetical protein [Acinetobacter sp. YH12126]
MENNSVKFPPSKLYFVRDTVQLMKCFINQAVFFYIEALHHLFNSSALFFINKINIHGFKSSVISAFEYNKVQQNLQLSYLSGCFYKFHAKKSLLMREAGHEKHI